MTPYRTSDGKYVSATFSESKQRFICTLTTDRRPSQSVTIDNIPNARKYSSLESVARAIRKQKRGEL